MHPCAGESAGPPLFLPGAVMQQPFDDESPAARTAKIREGGARPFTALYVTGMSGKIMLK